MTIQEIMTGLKEWLLNKFAQKDGDYVSLNSGTTNDFKKIRGGGQKKDGYIENAHKIILVQEQG